MTETNAAPSVVLIAQIEKLNTDRTKAVDAIEVIGKPAKAKAEELTTAIKALEESLAASLAREVAEARKARLTAYSDISVRVTYAPQAEGNLLRAAYTVEYTRDAYDMYYRRAVPKPHKANGFQSLPDEALDYLIECRPDAIPAEIMALAPGEPRLAFARYFLALRTYRMPTYRELAAA